MPDENGSISGSFLAGGSGDHVCSRCGGAERRLLISKTDSRGRRRKLLCLCGDCLALGSEVATGYNFVNQLAQWDRFSAVSVAMLTQGTSSRQARAKAREL